MCGSGATGVVIWYSYDGLGTAVLSFVPQAAPGFQKTGVIRGRTLQFSVGSDEYEWRCTEPILPGGGAYNLYVYFDRCGPSDTAQTLIKGEHVIA